MPTETITVPDFEFSGFYYPEILADLLQYLRVNVPEITDEDPVEPAIQLLRAYALSAHVNNVLLDLVANERFLPTAKLRASIRNHLKLIDFELKQASPASADVLLRLTRTFTGVPFVLVPAGALVATEETAELSGIDYEVLADFEVQSRTDRVSSVMAFNKTGSVFTVHTPTAQNPGFPWSPAWGTMENGDILYVGHTDVLFDRIDFVVTVVGANGVVGVWEFYDGDFDDGAPTSVTNLGATLELNVNSILGTASRAGAVVRVRSNLTGAFEDLVSTFSGGVNKVTTTGFLGQTTPSTSASDYTVGTDWDELTAVVDGTGTNQSFNQLGTKSVTFTLPQSETENWKKTTVNGVEAYWIRFRIISVVSGSPIVTMETVQIHNGKQYAVVQATQGRSREDDPLGSSTGLPDQFFVLSQFPVIEAGISIFVDEPPEQEWAEVDNFLNSTASDRHFTVEFDDDGRAAITFGDGTNGRVPPVGTDNVRATYRTMVEVDGNVGANTIVVNKSGISFVDQDRNPRAATGFAVREATTDEDKARVKIAGPASIRVLGRAVTPEDVEVLAVAFEDSAGGRPVKRAKAFEEAFGPKTIEAVVVGAGGASLTSAQLDELEEYFNGSVAKKIAGVLVMNTELTGTNYTPKVVNVTATVYGGSLASVTTALTGLLNPLALEEDGVTYSWDFGGSVFLARIIAAIMGTEPRPRNTTIAVPAADVPLGARELPVPGTLTITVIP